MEKTSQANGALKQAGIAILKYDKADRKQKLEDIGNITLYNKENSHQEDITMPNLYAWEVGAPNLTHTLLDIKAQINPTQ
jgi:hypothetical protein